VQNSFSPRTIPLKRELRGRQLTFQISTVSAIDGLHNHNMIELNNYILKMRRSLDLSFLDDAQRAKSYGLYPKGQGWSITTKINNNLI
jgi:hypothetical protein